ncbi:hypothetical protein T484DRAFT_1850986 [Baffinella frigidus]|nr:hypothetical protein T484DRAFT_1850986 [Cryptophyta sp. CCMP2293]
MRRATVAVPRLFETVEERVFPRVGAFVVLKNFMLQGAVWGQRQVARGDPRSRGAAPLFLLPEVLPVWPKILRAMPQGTVSGCAGGTGGGQVESAEDGGSPPERGSSPSRSTGSGDRKKKNRRQKAEEARLRLAELQGRLHGLDAAEVELKKKKYRDTEEREEAATSLVELKKYRDKEEREEAATAAAYAALAKEQLEASFQALVGG